MKWGPWQEREQKAFLEEFIHRKCPVIPVFLENCSITPNELPPFLKGMTCVDFRTKEPDPLKRLIYGITGVNPHENSTTKRQSGY